MNLMHERRVFEIIVLHIIVSELGARNSSIGHSTLCSAFSVFIISEFLSVEVGYEYEMCPSIVWDFHLTKVKGLDPLMAQSIGGWSMNIHHRYHKGVVHLGNGGVMELNRQPPMMSTVMGTGAQRHATCDQCTGKCISYYI